MRYIWLAVGLGFIIWCATLAPYTTAMVIVVWIIVICAKVRPRVPVQPEPHKVRSDDVVDVWSLPYGYDGPVPPEPRDISDQVQVRFKIQDRPISCRNSLSVKCDWPDCHCTWSN